MYIYIHVRSCTLYIHMYMYMFAKGEHLHILYIHVYTCTYICSCTCTCTYMFKLIINITCVLCVYTMCVYIHVYEVVSETDLTIFSTFGLPKPVSEKGNGDFPKASLVRRTAYFRKCHMFKMTSCGLR